MDGDIEEVAHGLLCAFQSLEHVQSDISEDRCRIPLTLRAVVLAFRLKYTAFPSKVEARMAELKDGPMPGFAVGAVVAMVGLRFRMDDMSGSSSSERDVVALRKRMKIINR